jgi:anti-sigma B factor antagonist
MNMVNDLSWQGAPLVCLSRRGVAFYPSGAHPAVVPAGVRAAVKTLGDTRMTTESRSTSQGKEIVQLEGPVDLTTVPAIRRRLLDCAKKRDTNQMCLDLSQVTVLDTAGVAMLVEVWRSLARRDGKLCLTGLSGNARRLVQLAQLDQLFEMRGDAA